MLPEWLCQGPVSLPDVTFDGRRSSFIDQTLKGIKRFLNILQDSEQLAGRPGFLQKIDPRLKLITLALTIVGVTLTHRLSVLAVLYALTLGLALLSRLPLGLFLSRTWVFIPFFTALMVLPLLWMRPGLALAGLLVMRVATAISWTLLLLWTTRWHSLFNALQVVRVPQAMVMTLSLTIRYLLLFVRQMEESHSALKSRVLQILPGPQGRRVVAGMVATLLQKSFQWSEEIYGAMVSRGYAGRVVLSEPARLSRWDALWFGCWMMGIALLWRGFP